MPGEIEHIQHLERRVIEECEELAATISRAHLYGYMNRHPKHDNLRGWECVLWQIMVVCKVGKKLEKSLRKEFIKT